MTANAILLIVLFLGSLVLLTPLLGAWMARIFQGERHFLKPFIGPLERSLYRLSGIDPSLEMTWQEFTIALLTINGFGFVVVLLLQRFQAYLPLNPEAIGVVSWPLALNTAVSFVTNTNWQAYSGEATLSYLTQMLGLAVQNFLSAATGIAVLLALARGISRKSAQSVGNYWVDLTRATLYVLLPLSFLLAVILVSQGVVQTFVPYAHATTLQGSDHVITLGPAASQIAIKQLGTNGGGFFGVNSTHPFENPTPLSNFLQMLAILLLPAALTFTYGKLVGNQRHGWAIFTAMFILLLGGLGVSLYSEFQGNPVFPQTSLLEGKEMRLGITNSVIWSVATTAASNGSVNAMHSSLTPLAGGVALFNIMLGEVVFGGVGAGLYGMLMLVILTVFLSGLMVGRTPEYLGKKIEAFEIKAAVVAVLIPSVCVLMFSAIACATTAGQAGPANSGPHALTEILYAFASMSNNNGSAFAGLSANTNFYNLLGAVAMLVGRFAVIIPVLIIAGSLVKKKASPPSSGTFPTEGALFIGLLTAIVIIVGALTFFPALSLGPVLEHLMLQAGRLL